MRVSISALALICFVLSQQKAQAFTSIGKRKNTQRKAFQIQSTVSLPSETTEKIASVTTEEQKRVAVLVCPAQFCVPDDYQSLLEKLQSRGNERRTIGTCRVAPLPRTEWIKVAKQLPTQRFLKAELDVRETLEWYFQAIENGLSDIYAEEGDDINVCIIGHSIGGWVARAYLGGLSGSSTAVHRLTQNRVSSFITLGTPHSNPDSALVDQTRGLLNAVCEAESCSASALASRGIEIACVGSSSVPGNVLTSNIDEIVAATSYFPLTGQWNKDTMKGDGIVPASLSFMEGAKRVEILDKMVRHAHVLPTPWNLWDGYARSIELPNEYGDWYGSDKVLDDWVHCIK